MKQYSYFELFAGAGGVGLGLQATGRFNCVGFSEIDPHAAATFSRHHPGKRNFGDITKISGIPPVNLLCGGFPCQDISLAGASSGKRLGLAGARSGLWFEMLRLIDKTQPNVVLIENSDQLVKKGLDVVLLGLAEAGYDAEWYTIPASAVGAPHKRLRCYVIAYHREEGAAGLEPSFNLSPSRQWGWRGQTDLCEIYSRPFVRSSMWPQPILRRMDDGLAGRAHRLHQVGNGVCAPVIEQLGHYIARRLDAAA